MAQYIRADAIWGMASGLSRDVSVNTFHFILPDTPDPGSLDAIDGALLDFYDKTGTDPDIKSLLSPVLSEGVTFKLYSATEEGAPIATYFHDIGDPSASSALPNEVACCLSYRAAPSPGVPPARLRGRVFIGPLNTDAVLSTGPSGAQPSDDLILALANAGSGLVDNASINTLGVYWVVYSRAGDLFSIVTDGWVDNEFDTQRRRQVDATVRTPWNP